MKISSRAARFGVAAAMVGGFALSSIPAAQAYTLDYVGRYPTYARCETAAATASNLNKESTGYECVLNSYDNYWDAYLFLN